MYMAGYM